MNELLKGVANYVVREALYGFYNKRDVNHGDKDMATLRAYKSLLYCIKNDYQDTMMAKEITKSVLMGYWGRPLGEMDIVGDRYRRAAFEVYKAIQDSIKKTQINTIDGD